MSTDSLRKYLVTHRPYHVVSASSLARGYNSNTPSAVRILKQLGYVQATDNSGWTCENSPELVSKPPIYVSKETVLKIKTGTKPPTQLLEELKELLQAEKVDVEAIYRKAVVLLVRSGVEKAQF